jgi:hypothetical protein
MLQVVRAYWIAPGSEGVPGNNSNLYLTVRAGKWKTNFSQKERNE